MARDEEISKIKIEAMRKATEMLAAMISAKTNPMVKIDGETLKVYKELDEWGFLEKFPIEVDANKWMYTAMMAMTQFRHLKWAHDHPEKSKRSKWEVVHGMVRGR